MEVTAIRTPLIETGHDLFAVFRDTFRRLVAERDIVCVTSKVIALEQGRVRRLADVIPSDAAHRLERPRSARGAGVHPGLKELVLQEAEGFYDDGLVYLTLKDKVFVANAGIDLSNVPRGYAVLWPKDPWEWVRGFRERLRTHYRLEDVGVVATDSHLTPLRRGVTGLAIAYSGFEGVQSEIGRPDLYGKPLEFTEKGVADDLASAAVLMMGEAAERTPFALIRGAPVIFTDREADPIETFIHPSKDLFAALYDENLKERLDIPMKHVPTRG
jgi:coenzyme F420-0:L-glutamate ligase